jgi:hypothetical protein
MAQTSRDGHDREVARQIAGNQRKLLKLIAWVGITKNLEKVKGRARVREDLDISRSLPPVSGQVAII